MNRNPLPPYVRRIGITCALTAALLLWPLPASAGLIWNLCAAVGYASLIFAFVLYVYPLRGEGIAHRRLLRLWQHRRVGWIALGLGALHAVTLLAAQPLTSRYLLPSAPLYMLCGLAALIALGVLVATGISARSPAGIAAHAVLAALLLALLGAHIIGSGQMLDRPSKAIAACLILALALLGSALRARWAHTRSRLLSSAVPGVMAAAALLLLPTPTGGSRLLQPAMSPPHVQVFFPHENHRAVSCITCHHNFVDKTGTDSCFDCHRGHRADLRQAAEATFHVLCRNCHVQLASQQAKHGPVRECSGCHDERIDTGAGHDR